MSDRNNSWKFIGEDGEFRLKGADNYNRLYFPLTNEAGMMSAITPLLNGDIKTGQNTFAMEPVSVENLHNNRSSRNFWFLIDDQKLWSAAGNSAEQHAKKFTVENDESTTVEAGFLWHKIIRKSEELKIESEITNFVPANDDQVELMQVKIINKGDRARKITPTAAIPIYGRSADNLRDHRHVTALLHRTKTIKNGVVVSPTLSFDERGHKKNDAAYAVVGAEDNSAEPIGFYPVQEDFVGEGGFLDWPEAAANKSDDYLKAGEKIDGYETIGALRFEDITLEPGQEKSYILAVVIDEENDLIGSAAAKYCSAEKFEKYLKENKDFWKNKLDKLQFDSAENKFDQWMRWVTLQPILRRIYGCSFLPHHDYGRGGRGWRDLWQDCLALLIMEPEGVRETLFNNFAGIRFDGTNATIIGSKPGEFIADRNNISRVWMDHGAWPLLTTKLYIDQSGDLDFLLEDQTYFKDSHTAFGNQIDEKWNQAYGNQMLDKQDNVYQGSILEHLLVQHLTLFFNVGEHNNFRLEGADWNDGLDMAEENGESVTFTALYASNLLELTELLKALKKDKNLDQIELAAELEVLFDSLADSVDYESVSAKHELLDKYFATYNHKVSGKKKKFDIDSLISDLEKKANWIIEDLRKNEWLENEEGYKWFNGYYNNDSQRLEGDFDSGVRMTLTGQVFPIMGGVATEEQIEEIIKTADHYLKDDNVGGYRLNTNFNEVLMNMGRAYGFAFGHKENGAMFSHMAVMYSNALYQRGFAEAGNEVISSIYNQCLNFEESRIYPGIPEYINNRGRGMYHYLTGSASWLLLTMVTQVYGVRGKLGDLVLEPKLMQEQFDESGRASIRTVFADRELKITFKNPEQLSYQNYSIKAVLLNGEEIDFESSEKGAVIDRKLISSLNESKTVEIEVELS
ncbi:MAG: GH36-type glycosyl hydrolase domain-containing protein [Halanaerobium sp.]